MARTGAFHHVGTFLLFCAGVLLLITTISAPVVHDIGILKVTLTNQTNGHNSSVSFGTFGHCIDDVASTGNGPDYYCTSKHVGYKPAIIMNEIDGTSFSNAAKDTVDHLTDVMILHPIACGLAFIAFLTALGAGMIGGLFASLIAAVTWLITLVVMVIDFVLFGIVKNHVNKDGTGSKAVYSVGMWTCLAAMVCLFFATFIVFFSCCSARRHNRDNRRSKAGDAGYGNTAYVDGNAGYPNGPTTVRTSRRRFW